MSQLRHPLDEPHQRAPQHQPTSIRLEDVEYTYDAKTPWAHPALHGISLTISGGDRLLVVGENGSGKSTLAWILAGLFTPTAGTALLSGRPLTKQTQHLGLLIQHSRLQLLSPTVGEEFQTYGIAPEAAGFALRQMGLGSDFYRRRLDELSVGQLRRVGLAILFTRRCPVIILDEPLAGLDKEGAAMIAAATEALPTSTTVLTVTHDQKASAPLATEAIELKDGAITGRWDV